MQTNIIIDTKESSPVMESIRNFKIIDNSVYSDEMVKILKSNTITSRHKKIKQFGEVWWHEIEDVIKAEPKNNKITSVHFDYIDRGVNDWEKFVDLLRDKYKNLKNISFSQLFGHCGSDDFDLIVLHDSEVCGFYKSNVLFYKEFLSDNDDHDYYLVVAKSDGYFVYISDKKPNII